MDPIHILQVNMRGTGGGTLATVKDTVVVASWS